jgi:hypothetical protein
MGNSVLQIGYPANVDSARGWSSEHNAAIMEKHQGPSWSVQVWKSLAAGVDPRRASLTRKPGQGACACDPSVVLSCFCGLNNELNFPVKQKQAILFFSSVCRPAVCSGWAKVTSK